MQGLVISDLEPCSCIWTLRDKCDMSMVPAGLHLIWGTVGVTKWTNFCYSVPWLVCVLYCKYIFVTLVWCVLKDVKVHHSECNIVALLYCDLPDTALIGWIKTWESRGENKATLRSTQLAAWTEMPEWTSRTVWKYKSYSIIGHTERWTSRTVWKYKS